MPAHRIIGNVYYVGSKDLATYLITTSAGHILINSGFERTVPLIRKSVESLGFKITDVKIVRSCRHFDNVTFGINSRWQVCFSSHEGTTDFWIRRFTNTARPARFTMESGWLDGDGIPWWLMDDNVGRAFAWGDRHFGFATATAPLFPRGGPTYQVEDWFVASRYWQLIVLLSLLPMISLIRFLHARRRTDKTCCRSWGYNLTANTSGVCPECGALIRPVVETFT